MAVSYLGNRGTKIGTASADGIVTVQPSKIVLPGDLLILNVAASIAGVSPRNVNDTQGNEWQVDASILNTSRVSICSSVLAFELQPSDTISLNIGVSVTYCLDLEEFSGVLSPSWKDVTATGSGFGVSLDSGTTSATAQAAEVCIGAFAINTVESAFTPGGSYSGFGIVSLSGLSLIGEYLIVSGTGTQNATAGAQTSGTWAGAIATYKAGSDVGLTEQRGPDSYMTR